MQHQIEIADLPKILPALLAAQTDVRVEVHPDGRQFLVAGSEDHMTVIVQSAVDATEPCAFTLPRDFVLHALDHEGTSLGLLYDDVAKEVTGEFAGRCPCVEAAPFDWRAELVGTSV